MWSLGFRGFEVGFRAQSLGVEVWGLGWVLGMVEGLEFGGSGVEIGFGVRDLLDGVEVHPDLLDFPDPRMLPVHLHRSVSRDSKFWFRSSGFGIRFSGFGFRDSALGFRVLGFGFQVSGFEFWDPGFEFRGWGLGSRV